MDRFPSYQVILESHPFSYIHHAGSESNIDHIIHSLSMTMSVHVEAQDLDHRHISLTPTLSSSCKNIDEYPSLPGSLKKVT